MTMRSARRRVEWVLILLYLLPPFITIRGESALRFDVPTLKLHVFGTTLWMQEFFLVLLATIFLVALFLTLTLLLGRVWCGWLCPQTVAADLTGFMDRIKKKGPGGKIAAHLLLALLSFVFGFITVCYFVSPYEAIPRALNGTLGPVATWSTVILGLITYLNFAFVRRAFCATICPYAKIQGVLTDDRSLIIQMDPARREECIDCKMCVRGCPTGVDIRDGMQVSCIMCAECVDACRAVMGRKKRAGLIGYSFGSQGIRSSAELARSGVLVLAIATLASLAALLYQSGARSLVDFTILPHPMEARLTREGDTMNAYILSVKNKSGQEMRLAYRLSPDEGFSSSVTGELVVPAGLVEKFPLFVRFRGAIESSRKLEIVLSDQADPTRSVRKSVYFNKP